MRIYAPIAVLDHACPSCGAQPGFWCSPWKACEKRVHLATKETS